MWMKSFVQCSISIFLCQQKQIEMKYDIMSSSHLSLGVFVGPQGLMFLNVILFEISIHFLRFVHFGSNTGLSLVNY